MFLVLSLNDQETSMSAVNGFIFIFYMKKPRGKLTGPRPGGNEV